ncbi:glycosyltransferase [Fodinicola feengrottensis]|uniref:Glycosyltransferase n=1 Tax=Fodinicola feengrottensis TaxID=435914 RepID=A0ABP4RQB8_9ACTN
MSAHIAVTNLPAAGHVLPTLGVVAELVERGHRVSYVAIERYAEAVRAAGAEHVPYKSPMEGMHPPTDITADVIAQVPLAFLNESKASTAALEAHFAGDRPDLLMYDVSIGTGPRLLAQQWKRPGVVTFPTLTGNEHFRFDKALMGDHVLDPTHPALAEYGQAFADFTAAYGMPGATMQEVEKTVPEHTLVFVAREFQPCGDTFGADHTFAGPCLTERSYQGSWTPPAGEKKILLVSLGTGYNFQPDFFRECVRAAAALPDWHLVIATGDRVDSADLGELPSNVEAHHRVPQLDMLAHATAFVSHAGMGSTMESLFFGVPLVAVPQMVEQEVNAGRIAELGVGVRLDRTTVDAEQIRAAVRQVSTDPGIRANTVKMQRQIRAAGGRAAAADAVEAHLVTGTN